MRENEAVLNLGRLIKSMPYEHGKEHQYVFNMSHNTFFQKLIPLEMVECGFNIEPRYYMGLMMYLDYLNSVLLDDSKTLTNLKAIYDKMSEGNHGYKFDASMVVKESGLRAKEVLLEKGAEGGFASLAEEIKCRYDLQDFVLDEHSERENDPYYDAIAKHLYNLFMGDFKEEAKNVKSKSGLKALIFVDYSMMYINDGDARRKVTERASAHDYVGASVAAIDCLQGEVTIQGKLEMIKNG